jgi:hypothetical protein
LQSEPQFGWKFWDCCDKKAVKEYGEQRFLEAEMIFRILTLPMAKKNEVCSIRARHAY